MHCEGEVVYLRLKLILSQTHVDYNRTQLTHAQFALDKNDIVAEVSSSLPVFLSTSHLVSVVVPSIGASHDHHPVLPTVWLLGGKRVHQPETQAEQDGHKHVLGFCGSGQAPLIKFTLAVKLQLVFWTVRWKQNDGRTAPTKHQQAT